MRSIKNKEQSRSGDHADRARYENMNEGELMNELLDRVAAAKADGSFSAEELDSFVRFVSPDLDEAARKKLTELVAMISAR